MAQPKKLSNKDLEAIGRTMMTVYETGYADRKRFYIQTFIKGVLAGLGGVVGATIVVALLLWVLSLLSAVPFVDDIRDTLQTEQQ